MIVRPLLLHLRDGKHSAFSPFRRPAVDPIGLEFRELIPELMATIVASCHSSSPRRILVVSANETEPNVLSTTRRPEKMYGYFRVRPNRPLPFQRMVGDAVFL